MRVVGRGVQPHRFDGGHHRPEAVARHQRRGGLHHGKPAGAQVLVQHGVKGLGIELAHGEVGGVGEIDHDHVKHLFGFFQPGEGVGVDDPDLAVVQGLAIQGGQRGGAAEDVGHGRVQLNQCDLLHAGVLEYFAHGHAVATTQNRHAARCTVRQHGGVHQCLVVAVFVALRKLQVAIQEQAVSDAARTRVVGDHNALIG